MNFCESRIEESLCIPLEVGIKVQRSVGGGDECMKDDYAFLSSYYYHYFKGGVEKEGIQSFIPFSPPHL